MFVSSLPLNVKLAWTVFRMKFLLLTMYHHFFNSSTLTIPFLLKETRHHRLCFLLIYWQNFIFYHVWKMLYHQSCGSHASRSAACIGYTHVWKVKMIKVSWKTPMVHPHVFTYCDWLYFFSGLCIDHGHRQLWGHRGPELGHFFRV